MLIMNQDHSGAPLRVHGPAADMLDLVQRDFTGTIAEGDGSVVMPMSHEVVSSMTCAAPMTTIVYTAKYGGADAYGVRVVMLQRIPTSGARVAYKVISNVFTKLPSDAYSTLFTDGTRPVMSTN